MATLLLAIGDRNLRDACRVGLEALGHAVIVLERPLSVLGLSRKITWDAVLLDSSSLGTSTLKSLGDADENAAPRIGVGLSQTGLHASISLPLTGTELAATIESLLNQSLHRTSLQLDAGRRAASYGGKEVLLTRTEYRLLALLAQRQPQEVSRTEMLESVWGFTEGKSTSELIRTHVRNLRTKLLELGLTDAIRSRRGSGYALVI